MANHQKVIQSKRQRKSRSVRKRVGGTAERPRLAIFRSSKFFYCQAIDDAKGHTLASASELEAALRPSCAELNKTESAKLVGKTIAERLKAAGVDKAVLDRRWYRYHGRVKAFADAAREAGLSF
jgi:large subunit ribosomal protein L18